MNLVHFLLFFSVFSFFFFGIGCFVSPRMKTEFSRYGLANKRILVGILQLLGALGLLIGYYLSPTLVLLSSACLFLLMILGFGVRLKIKDSVLQSAPALLYAFINGYIAVVYVLSLI